MFPCLGRVGLLTVPPVRLVLHGHARIESLRMEIEQVDSVSRRLELCGRPAGGVCGERIGTVMRDDDQGGAIMVLTTVVRQGISPDWL